jgi:ferredoxin
MVRLVFEGAARQQADVARGTRVMDVCDEIGAVVPFACRDANCGICMIAVAEGAALLSPASADERAVVTQTGGPAEARLACQARVCADVGVVRIVVKT